MKATSKVKTQILVNVEPEETRIAILEDGSLVEFMVERWDKSRILGNVYKGIATAVLPGMQAAFVDIGLEKSAYLHVSDVTGTVLECEDEEGLFLTDPVEGVREAPVTDWRNVPIESLLQKGQEILVQVTREPIATKGPRATTQLSLPGRFLVLMPNVNHLGISRKIEDGEERARLRSVVEPTRPEQMGLIVRTVGEGRDRRQFRSDVRYLMRLWTRIRRKAERATAPALVHKEAELTSGLIRDLFTEDVDELIVDSRAEHRRILAYLRWVSPELRSRVSLYDEEVSLFDAYGIEAEIEKTLHRKVWLKHGGYICIDHTEALVAIDVNTGRYVGRKNHEETIFRTNFEATKEIARQLRLRDIGGLIVIDFIDMEIEGNRKKVLDEFRNALRRDRSRTKTLRVSDLGLVEMTRQMVRPSLLHYFSEPCPSCDGTGRVLSKASMLMKIERNLRRLRGVTNDRAVRVEVESSLADHFNKELARSLQAFQKKYRIRARIRGNPQLRPEEYRIYSEKSGADLTNKVRS